MPEPGASVVVRAKDEARTIERTLAALRRQTVPVEIVVVDSGSTDGTVEIARRWSDRLIEIPAEDFTYGGALNLGAEAARAPFHFALSAHCFPERDDWVELSLRHYERDDVAGTNGIQTLPDGRPVDSVFHQGAEHARANVRWGFSNHASSWRAELWRRFPFDAGLTSSEDRKWALEVTAAGWVIAFDPALWVDLSHQWRGGALFQFRRKRLETRGLAELAALPPYRLRDALTEWWRVPDERHSAAFHRLNYRRLAGIAGVYRGLAATRRRGS
ncbi:MAG TPA: glycosyltransferase family 2 protein [Gaiellaceae bacterium]|nr:glycosyltransferase family 2 protein [Gaiellaceae bacterium]